MQEFVGPLGPARAKSTAIKVKSNARAGMNKGDLVNCISMPTLNRQRR